MNFFRFLIVLLLINAEIARAAGPFIWGPDRAQNLTTYGGLLSDLSKLDNDGLQQYIKNGHFEVASTGWSTYADAAGTTPVDCTGGAPTETFARSTSSPLIQTASGLLTKDAANRQGEGVSYAFTIDSGYVSSTMSIYLVGSSGGTYVAGDLGVYLYDVTGTAVITPTSTNLASSGTFVATFSTTANTNYRLCIHTKTTSANAYTYKLDGIFVGPNNPNFSNPMNTRGQMIRQGASAPEAFTASTDNRVVRGDGTDAVLGQIDDPAFFTAGAAASASDIGIVTTSAQSLSGLKEFQGGLINRTNLNSGSGTVTLTITDNPYQSFSAASTVVLPTTSVLAGQLWLIENRQTASTITIQSSNTNTIDTIINGYAILEALQDTPTTSAHWRVVEITSLESVTATGSGDYTAGVLRVTRVNSNINVTVTTNVTFSSNSNPLSATGLIPAFARPAATKSNIYSSSTVQVLLMAVRADGTLEFAFYNWAGTLDNRTSSSTNATMAYTVP